MKNRAAWLIVMLLVANLMLAADQPKPPEPLRFKAQGFSIAPLESPPAEGGRQALMMSLAPTEQFSPNVNVMIQPYQGSMADFLVLSRKQFKEMNLTIVRDETVGAAHVFEYKGTMMNRQLHWYARMQANRGFVYLATATAQETQWKDVSDRLKACVDSLKPE